jgi:hypothetical protein
MFTVTQALATEYERVPVGKCWKLKKELPAQVSGMTIPTRICVEFMDVQMVPKSHKGHQVTLFGHMEIAGSKVSLYDTHEIEEQRDHDGDFYAYGKEPMTVYGRNDNPENDWFDGPVKYRLWMQVYVNNEYENRVRPGGLWFTGVVSTMDRNLVVWSPEFVEEK